MYQDSMILSVQDAVLPYFPAGLPWHISCLIPASPSCHKSVSISNPIFDPVSHPIFDLISHPVFDPANLTLLKAFPCLPFLHPPFVCAAKAICFSLPKWLVSWNFGKKPDTEQIGVSHIRIWNNTVREKFSCSKLTTHAKIFQANVRRSFQTFQNEHNTISCVLSVSSHHSLHHLVVSAPCVNIPFAVFLHHNCPNQSRYTNVLI